MLKILLGKEEEPMSNLSTIAQNSSILLIFKIGSLIIIAFYVLFLLVILKQIRSMNTIIAQPDLFPIIQGALFLLIGFAVFLFLLMVTHFVRIIHVDCLIPIGKKN